MKKVAKELQAKSVEELMKESQMLRGEIAKMGIESRIKPEKDSNLLFKKKKRLAVALTMISQKNLGVK